MSILSALKAKGARGKNIEEAVKTLPIGGGSSGSLTVIFTSEDQGSTYTANKTFQEIRDALDNYVPIFGFIAYEESDPQPILFTGLTYIPYDDDDDYGKAFFMTTYYFSSDGYMSVKELVINIDNTVTYTESNFALTPYV